MAEEEGREERRAVRLSFKGNHGRTVNRVEKTKVDQLQEGVELLMFYDEEVTTRKAVPAAKVIPKQPDTWLRDDDAAASRRDAEAEVLRKALQELPNEASLEQYESMPVEEFGEALLRGMGWEKGKPIGRRCKHVVEPVEFKRREHLLGLGAKPVPRDIVKNSLG